MRLLVIETSTERGVIAYIDHHTLLFERELPFGLNQSKFLMPHLFDSLRPFGCPPFGVEAIGVGIGPGSYTGIRLGVSVAQTLAYSWKVPLVGVSSLYGFIPLEGEGAFAALVDARIGGAYVWKGWKDSTGIREESAPQVYPLEEVGELLNTVSYLVTPFAKTLQAKLERLYPNHCEQWQWQERAPAVRHLAHQMEQAYAQGRAVRPPQALELMYLRQTEAEREKMQAG
jgi:tRNA threonylcarbamoyl adenosine modification protein YeaZ